MTSCALLAGFGHAGVVALVTRCSETMMVVSASAPRFNCTAHRPLTRHQDGGWAARIEEKQGEAIDRKSAITEKARRAAELRQILVAVNLLKDLRLSWLAVEDDEAVLVLGESLGALRYLDLLLACWRRVDSTEDAAKLLLPSAANIDRCSSGNTPTGTRDEVLNCRRR